MERKDVQEEQKNPKRLFSWLHSNVNQTDNANNGVIKRQQINKKRTNGKIS